MLKRYLMAPGPTEVPSEVLAALGKPTMHHRLPAFSDLFMKVSEDLKKFFMTKNDVYSFASSGTGALESAVVNLLSAGDEAICVRGGKFGERWAEICTAYGVKAINLDVEWGDVAKPEQIEELLKANPNVKAVFTTLCETSTAVVTPVKDIAAVVAKTDAVLVTDAVSAIGALELRTDDWRVDVVVAGSQKALMLPPGMGFITLSDKAWKLVESSTLPKYYFDLKKAKKTLGNKTTAFTPPVNMFYALEAALELILEEGMENIWTRTSKLGAASRAAAQALGLKLYSKVPADNLTAVCVPEGIDGGKFTKVLRDKYGITIAGGQADLKGKIFRISTMGYSDRMDIPLVFSAIEMVLAEMGHPVERGAGVKAAEEALADF